MVDALPPSQRANLKNFRNINGPTEQTLSYIGHKLSYDISRRAFRVVLDSITAITTVGVLQLGVGGWVTSIAWIRPLLLLIHFRGRFLDV